MLQILVNKLVGAKFSAVFNQYNNTTDTFIGYQDFEDYYHQENRETTQKLIHTLESEIEHLREEIAFLRKMAEKEYGWREIRS